MLATIAALAQSDMVKSGSGDESQTAVLDRVLANYDRLTRPGLSDAARSSCPADALVDDVNMTMDVDTLVSFSEKDGAYTLEGYLRLEWVDSRLTYNRSACGLEQIRITSSASFWVPDVYFEHMSSHKLAGNGELFSFDPDGHVFWSRHAKLEVECNMGFGRLPFDVQNCLFLVGMYSQTAAQVRLRWKDALSPLGSHLTKDNLVVAGQWAIGSVNGEDVTDYYPSGNYSYAKACIRFERQSSAYTQQILLACLYVAMSYIGTWINPTATPGRIMLSVTCVLIVANNFQSVKASLPLVSYNVFLLDFLFFCALFNCFFLVSYAMINFGLIVDEQMEKVSKAATATDADDDGVLDWSELRKAVLLTKASVLANDASARRLPVQNKARTTGTSNPGPFGDPNEAPPNPTFDITTMSFSRGSREDEVGRPPKKKRTIFDSWGVLPTLHALKPERVRDWRYMDRYLRVIMPIGFLTYLVLMFSLVDTWPTSTPEARSVVKECH